MQDVIRMTYDVALCHPDDITQSIPYVIRISWLPAVSHPDDFRTQQYVIRMTYDVALCHPDDMKSFSTSGCVKDTPVCHPDDLRICLMSSGCCSLSHPDDLVRYRQFLIRMIKYTAVYHPDDLKMCLMSSGWENYVMTYGQYSMSSGWHTKLPWVIRMT